MAGEVLAGMLKKAKGNETQVTDLVFGRVTSVTPLKIMVESRFEITYDFIILSQMVRDLTVYLDVGGQPHAVQVFRDLRVGDKVRMLRGRQGQVFYVLARV